MRITLVIQSNSCGGAERVMSIMANHWAAQDWKITLLTLDDGSVTPFYALDSRINHQSLGVANNSKTPAAAIPNNLKRVSVLRRAIRSSRPEAVISFMSVTNVTTMMASVGLGVPVIVAEHSNPRVNPANRTWRLLRLLTYRFADRVVVLNEDAADYFRQTKNTSVRVIPNPVIAPAPNQTRTDCQVGPRMLVAMGRLVHVKGFDLLLQAFAKLKDKRADWELTILGEGPLRAELESLRDELGLANTVTFPGTVTNPDHFLSQADLFVMSSRVEGFPMALCEAMASGLPVICTEYSSGPREIITNEFDGLLVPSEDVTALATAMDRLMGDAPTRKRFGLNAVAVAERFSIRRVMGLWEEILNDCVLRHGIRTAEMRLACQ